MVVAGLAATGARAAPKPAGAVARGSSCAKPWQVTYARGRVAGDTREVYLKVTLAGSRITIAWHARPGYDFCHITLTEGRGQVFASTNPSASYTYTDVTKNHSNGIRSLTATARSPHRPASK